MSDTNVQECKCCQIETDCIDGLCDICSEYNHKLQSEYDKIKQQRDDLLAVLERIAKECWDAFKGAGLPKFEFYTRWYVLAKQAICIAKTPEKEKQNEKDTRKPQTRHSNGRSR